MEQRAARLRAAERSILLVRTAAVGFAIGQVLTYYLPYPPGVRPVALAVVGFLALGNLGVFLAYRRWTDPAGIRRVALLGHAVDFVTVSAFVFVYTFDPDTAIWATIYILPLEGAVRFQRRGAFLTMAAATLVYAAREVYGNAVYGNDLLLTSISFRMGLGFLFAGVAGAMSYHLVRQIDRVQMLYATSRTLAASLDQQQVLAGFARSACEAIGGRFAILYRWTPAKGLEPAASFGTPVALRGALEGTIRRTDEEAPAMRALAEARPVWSGDLLPGGEAATCGEASRALAEAGVRSLVALPIRKVEPEQAAVLAVYLPGVRRRSADDEALLRAVVGAAGVALSHASAYEEERTRGEELRRLQELRAKFLAMVAHDVRGPLSVIRAAAATLRRAGAQRDPEVETRLLESVERQVDRASQLTEDLLDLARLEVGGIDISLEPVPLAVVVRGSLDDVAGAETVEVDVPDEVVVRADPHRLARVMVNLVSNALRHGAPPVRVRARTEDSKVLLAVSDGGPGLPPGRAEQPFQSFVPGQAEGSVGLGLAIVRALVEAQGGSVRYRPNRPSGASFELTFPLATAEGPLRASGNVAAS